MSNNKEKMNRQVIFQVQPSLYYDFANACELNYKRISDVLRELMLEYTKKQGKLQGKEEHEKQF